MNNIGFYLFDNIGKILFLIYLIFKKETVNIGSINGNNIVEAIVSTPTPSFGSSY